MSSEYQQVTQTCDKINDVCFKYMNKTAVFLYKTIQISGDSYNIVFNYANSSQCHNKPIDDMYTISKRRCDPYSIIRNINKSSPEYEQIKEVYNKYQNKCFSCDNSLTNWSN